MFDSFAQVRAGKGLGMGLALVRKLLELHGGSIKASSPGLGLGSTFEVNIPIRVAGQSMSGSPDAGGSSGSVRPTPGIGVPGPSDAPPDYPRS